MRLQEESLLHSSRGLLDTARFSPHLISESSLHDKEAHFLKWVAHEFAHERHRGTGADSEQEEISAAAEVVLQALRSEEERLHVRRRQLDDNVHALTYSPQSTLAEVDEEKIGLRRPLDRWWERKNKSFTDENTRNNLLLKMAAGEQRRSWVHRTRGIVLEEGELVSPETDRLQKKRTMQEIGFLQRRGKSWCAQPIDKSLRMPGTCIKKVARYSAAPEIDAMQMDLGDQIRTADGWLWVVRCCGRKRQWVRTNFEPSIRIKSRGHQKAGDSPDSKATGQ